MTMLTSVMICFMCLLFPFVKSPLLLSILIVIQVLFVCISGFMIFKTPWFCYILAMLFISGMMIIFMYVSSLASNEYMYFKSSLSMVSVVVFTLCFMLSMVKFLNLSSVYYLVSMAECFSESPSIMSYKIYSSSLMFFTILLVIYLFMALISVVKNVSITKGPLRCKS